MCDYQEMYPDAENRRAAAAKVLQGQQLLREGRRQTALVSFRAATQIDPEWAEAHYHYGAALGDSDDIEQAISSLRRSIELEPRLVNAHEILGSRLQKTGRFREATESFERAHTLDPSALGPLAGILRSKRITEEDRSYIKDLSAILEEDPPRSLQRARAHLALGKALDDLREYERAILQFDLANDILREQSQKEGRYFNPEGYRREIDLLIGKFGKDIFTTNNQLGQNNELPVLIVGMMRSGTTLVEQILSRHPDVATAGELSFWFEPTASQLMRSLIDGIVDHEKASETAESYRLLLRSIGPTKKRVTDKHPTNYWHLGLVHLLFRNARFIHCRRDPADTCLSIYSTPLGHQSEFAHDRMHIAVVYKEYLRLMEHWRSVIPADRLLDLEYEELVFDQEGQVRRILDFLGLTWEPDCLDPEKGAKTVLTPSLWQVRQPIYRSSVGRWRNYEPWIPEFVALRHIP